MTYVQNVADRTHRGDAWPPDPKTVDAYHTALMSVPRVAHLVVWPVVVRTKPRSKPRQGGGTSRSGLTRLRLDRGMRSGHSTGTGVDSLRTAGRLSVERWGFILRNASLHADPKAGFITTKELRTKWHSLRFMPIKF